MTVYLLFRRVQYEGSTVVGVFASEASAEAARLAATAALEPPWHDDVAYGYEARAVTP